MKIKNISKNPYHLVKATLHQPGVYCLPGKVVDIKDDLAKDLLKKYPKEFARVESPAAPKEKP